MAKVKKMTESLYVPVSCLLFEFWDAYAPSLPAIVTKFHKARKMRKKILTFSGMLDSFQKLNQGPSYNSQQTRNSCTSVFLLRSFPLMLSRNCFASYLYFYGQDFSFLRADIFGSSIYIQRGVNYFKINVLVISSIQYETLKVSCRNILHLQQNS